jgi:xanthine phosphoribosyltransferase
MSPMRPELSWTDVERLSGELARHLPAASGCPSFDRVVGVARGGLVPAVLVAGLLDVKAFESVQVLFYDGATRLDRPRRIGRAPAAAGPGGDPARTLVVDEILDTGRTMAFVREMLPAATYATLVARRSDPPLAQHAGLTAHGVGGEPGLRVWAGAVLDTAAWILFPWSPAEDRDAAREAP